MSYRLFALMSLTACGAAKIKLDDVNEINGKKAGLAVFQSNPDESATFFGQFDNSDAFDNHLTIFASDYESDLDGDGLCDQIDPLANLPPEEPGQSMGDVSIAVQGEVVLNAEFDAQFGGYFGDIPAPVGSEAYDLIFGGSSAVTGATIEELFAPVRVPIVDGTFDGNNQLQLTDTLTFQADDAEHLRVTFNLQENGQNVTVRCRPRNGTLDIAALRPRLALGGSFFVEASNISAAAITTPEGPAVLVGQAVASTSIGFRNE